ncbi:MAG: 23S rRNA (adenine(2503)-C(2))-methyltransferase RlmN [Treponema sp.]|nr:23S rRNA (adenine(2503)-C(2))-methyltransferase RlmN [Treponema sp.]
MITGNNVKNTALCGIPPEELKERLSPLPGFRAAQICKWAASGVSSFSGMNNLPLQLREELAERYLLRPRAAVEKRRSADGTVKLVLQFEDGASIEAVLLTDSSRRRTACLSTQAGCPAGCVFCKTGTAFARNLDSAEIIEQFLQLRAIADEGAALPIANIVVMGMGEPLLNLEELRRALAVITCKEGMNFSRRRITVSTCGIVPGIISLAGKGPAVRLALSLTTGDENLRKRLMPISQPLRQVKEALRYFQDRGGGRVTLEAVLLCGINTRAEDAEGIARFAAGLDAVVNLIPWNPVKGLEFEGCSLREPDAEEVNLFKRRLETLGLKVTCRYRRGRGVSGACGQLGNGEHGKRMK